MRQGDGSDLLDQSDPRNADIGILYVEPDDSRQEILTAINAQELHGRKQIAIVLPEQGKAFRQPVEFDGLKNMRRGLKAQLIFIAPSGPGPAEFARHRRFVVYSSLETFRTALLSERASFNPRSKQAASDEKKQGILGRNRASKERNQNSPLVPPTPRLAPGVPASSLMPPTPPTPRVMSTESAQPNMPPLSPTPRVQPQASGQDAQHGPTALPIMPIIPIPLEDMETHTLDFENPAVGRGSGSAGPPGAGMGALTANAFDDDDDLAPAPPVTPRQPQSGGIVPSIQGSATPGGPPVGPMRADPSARMPNTQRSPTPLLLGQQTNTPRPGGSGKLAAASQGSQTRVGTGKQPAVQGRSGSPGRGTKKLSPTPDVPDAPKQPDNKNGGTGKLPVAVPIGMAPAVAAAVLGESAAPSTANAVAAPGTAGGQGMNQRQVGLTPLPPPVSQRRRRSRGRKRFLLALLLILLTLVLVGWVVVSALGGPGGLATLGRLTATVSITPQSQTVQNNYLISAVTTAPDAAQRQVGARTLSAQSNTQQAMANATGSISATQASGKLRFINTNTTSITLASTTIMGSDGVQVTFNGPITVPFNPPFIDVDAYAVNAGAAGNIKAQDISHTCCFTNITVRNLAPFSGGRDAQPNSVIQQSDIDGAVRPLVAKLTASTRETLQKQMKSNERVADGSFVCPATTKADHNVGDHAPSVTVTVSVKCSEEVFDFAAAQQMASGLLQTNPPTNVNLTNYKLVGPIITNLTSASQVSGQGQIGINMQAAGKWVYQFSSQEQQQIKHALLNKSSTEAKGLIKQYVGVLSAIITISSGSTMPSNESDITLDIATIPGLQQGTPTSPSGGPTITPPGGGSPGVTPTNSPEQGS